MTPSLCQALPTRACSRRAGTAEFQRFADTHPGDLFGESGIYVLWDGRAKACPTYIGEGNLLKRLGDHSQRNARRFAKPLDGYIAIIGGISRGVHKTGRRLEGLQLMRTPLCGGQTSHTGRGYG